MKYSFVVHRGYAILHLPFPLCFPLSPGHSQQTQSHAQGEGERQREELGLKKHEEDTDMQQPEWGTLKGWEMRENEFKDTGMGILCG